MVLTLKVTVMGGLLLVKPPETVILTGPYVPAASPVGSAVTVTAAGVLPLGKLCPFTLSQLAPRGTERAKGMDAPVLLVTFTVWLTAEPPNWPEKVSVGLSTTMV